MRTVDLDTWKRQGGRCPAAWLTRLGLDPRNEDTLAATALFGPGDCTAGCENELQAAVAGERGQVDLPLTIERSNFYLNLVKRQRRGDTPARLVNDLDDYLASNPGGVWENSWVRLPLDSLSPAARRVWEQDLLADKADPGQGRRADVDNFFVRHQGRDYLRVPVSYLLKLALAEALGRQPGAPEVVRATIRRLMEHFLSDNTSPETFSFHVVDDSGPGLGQALAAETAKRYLLTQALLAYAEAAFGLAESGQRVLAYFAPHPPVRQKRLNDCVSDSFYRELFMSPCLSGWDRGEDKHRYMHLCHQTLSRAQFNALARLKEAGIITRNLVVLPGASNISLANNGVHISLGSRRLSRALATGQGEMGPAAEKYLGDLVIKFVEHFLPLFVGAYSAAPYRLDFADFHPERVLGFLPFELDYTHLRMIWRRWKKKARLKSRFLGLRLTPFGPPWLDNMLARGLGLGGDFVGDFRLLDYLVAVMSSHAAPALDGLPGNHERLKQDLAQQGLFDPCMPMYLLYRQREFEALGFSGFEGRHYSLFAGLQQDLAPAAELQRLVTALALVQIARGRLTMGHIPDGPEVESERRQAFFGAAIGIPTFYVRADSDNIFLRHLAQSSRRVRHSRRYSGYLRVYNHEYRRALLAYLRREGAGLIQAMGLEGVMDDLEARLDDPGLGAQSRLTRGVLERLGEKDPFRASAAEFNQAAEEHYRDGLRRAHLDEALAILARDLEEGRDLDGELGRALDWAGGRAGAARCLQAAGRGLAAGSLEPADTIGLINLLIVSLAADARRFAGGEPGNGREDKDAA
ncbi:MAG: hypothetical protein K9K66_15170 [Desulfarculaceae bacterium]|nr:hypothetical protein [Desulfarculaceae bacterium]MCF8074245.1 hypothetical protein [Desulfarculaceae bacterium]MCF8102996.1 hypothetical protein [Desulfarculaceae bacterium]MCF8117127.1 hypothetical protein [Desulfarculaceae bacterium]